MFKKSISISEVDSEIANVIKAEEKRQEEHIELIASENYTSPAVMAAQGSQLTNKYAEGYPNKRYYGGCEHVDVAEQLAIDRAKQLFGADYANVQPHSGSQANAAVYQALIKPGDTILGMSLADGGHLTHGYRHNMSARMFDSYTYDVDKETQLLDYDAIRKQAEEIKPTILLGGYSAYPRKVNFKSGSCTLDDI